MNRLLAKGLSTICITILLAGCLSEPPGNEVLFSTEDGVLLSGRIIGSGEKSILMSHMDGGSQEDWWEFAQLLSTYGYSSLTFDFRGYGKSSGNIDKSKLGIDLQAAVDYTRNTGITKILLLGASMGGTASISIASDNDISGLITLSSPAQIAGGLDVTSDIYSIEEPKLFIAAEDDKFHARSIDLFAQSSINVYEAYKLPGNKHGTNLFDDENSDKLNGLILDFLRRNY